MNAPTVFVDMRYYGGHNPPYETVRIKIGGLWRQEFAPDALFLRRREKTPDGTKISNGNGR